MQIVNALPCKVYDSLSIKRTANSKDLPLFLIWSLLRDLGNVVENIMEPSR